MARIRTVKPDLFRHEELYELEKEMKLPMRFYWIGLFTVADREGRFRWKPNVVKLDIAPYDDDVDFSRVLDAFATRGLLVKYACPSTGEMLGFIPTWQKHQVINNKERPSDLPKPEKDNIINNFPTREARVRHAKVDMLLLSQGEGKGREGKWKGKGRGREVVSDGLVFNEPNRSTEVSISQLVWDAYRTTYQERYGSDPVRNATVNSQIKNLVARLGKEAIEVVKFYVKQNQTFYTRTCHPVGLCLKDAESLRTQWATGMSTVPVTKALNQGLIEKILKEEADERTGN